MHGARQAFQEHVRRQCGQAHGPSATTKKLSFPLLSSGNGGNLRQFVNYQHVQCVCKKLQLGGRSISESALASGFQNLRSFNRVFRALIGTSPRTCFGASAEKPVLDTAGNGSSPSETISQECSREQDEPRQERKTAIPVNSGNASNARDWAAGLRKKRAPAPAAIARSTYAPLGNPSAHPSMHIQISLRNNTICSNPR